MNALVCDLDDTLIETYPAYEAAIENAAEFLHGRYGIATDTAGSLIRQLDLLGIGLETPWMRWSQRFEASLEAAVAALEMLTGGSDVEAAIRDIYLLSASVRTAPYPLKDGALELVDRARALGWKVVIFTKGDRVLQESKVRRHGLQHRAAVDVWDNVKTVEVWREMFARHDIDPRQCVVVGDSLREDIAPSLACGATAVYVQTPSHTLSGFMTAPCLPSMVITQLSELTERLDRLGQDET